MAIESLDSIDIDVKGCLSAFKRRRRLGVIVFALTLAAFAGLSTRLPRVYKAEGKLVFKGLDRSSSLAGVGSELDKLQSLLVTQSPLGTEKELLTSHFALQRVIDEVGIANKKGKPTPVKDFRKDLSVEIIGLTDVIKIGYKSKDKEKAQAVVDTLMSIYLSGAEAKQQDTTRKASAFVASQLPQVEAKLLQAESDLRQFKEANGIVDLSQEASLLSQGLASMRDRISGVAAELNGVSSQTQQLQNNFQLSFGQTVAVSTLSKSPEIRGALDELAVLERELAEARKIYLPDHPNVTSLQDERAILENTIATQLERFVGAKIPIPTGLLEDRGNRATLLESYIGFEIERLKLSEQFETLQNANADYVRRASLLPQLEATQAQLLRNVDVARTTYQTLLQKFQDVQIAENKTSSNAEVAQPAVLPDSKGSTGRVVFLGSGMMMGLLLASVAILMAELRDISLNTLKDIKGSFDYPLLGVIPAELPHGKISQSELEIQQFEHFLENREASFLNDAYWMMQENIRFLNARKSLKTLVVTSAVAAEGKSMVAASLAATMARQGRRVLIIDADFRNPAQQSIWKLGPEPGLSEILRRGLKEFQPQQSPDVENLKVLVAGEPVESPLRLLSSKKMFALVRATADYFDHIIIDAPPLLQAADALPLGRMSDGMLLVTRPGVINRTYSSIAQELLNKHEQSILGLVVNGVNGGYFPQAQSVSEFSSPQVQLST